MRSHIVASPGLRLHVVRTARRRAEWPSEQAMIDDLCTKSTFRGWLPEALSQRTDRVPLAQAERAVREIPESTLLELPGLGHFAPMEDPRAVAGAVRGFLAAR